IELSKAITDSSNWHFQTSELYGVKFALPTFPGKADSGTIFPNFVDETGTVTLVGLAIPSDIYPGTNFVGGTFLLSVNPQITNRESCEKFGTSDPRFLSQYTIGGMRYEKLEAGGAEAGTSYDDQYFHTFQNGMCYEVAFSAGSYNTGNVDLGCRIPKAGDTDKLLEEFMRRISYSPPTIVSLPKNPGAAPTVTSFTSSSATADDVTNRAGITFSWTTEGADYVEFSYHCSAFGQGLVILEEGGAGGRNCDNDPKPIEPQTQQVNHPPNSSTGVTFGNFHHDDPIALVVTLTPFSHGKANPSASRSLTISVDPHNPFPAGIPNATANLALTYAGGAKTAYQQGSSLTINWTDTLSRDPCVDLYLVQAKPDGQQYVAQIVSKCLQPAASGSYTWTIPDRNSGASFRIYVVAPGRTSSAFGPAFDIIKAEPKPH
ncbi:MAG: Ser-Thr-rich GPI-anchored membrane family protein, partial [Candidatus Sulfotelmatobacter sp.]